MANRLPACLAALILAAAALAARAQTNTPAAAGPSAGDLIKILAATDDPARAAQAAQALGDRAIAGPVKLSEEEAKALHAAVTACIRRSRQPAEMAEANRQVQRLWHLAGPALLDGLDNLETYSFSAKCLAVMKNEAVVKALVEKAKKTEDGPRKGLIRFALQSMKNRRTPSVPGRPALTAEESDKLYNDLIAPALEELK